MSELATKQPHRREATLYRPLAGAGARGGASDPAAGAASAQRAAGTLQALRAAALEAYRDAELPAWRRSGFWTTSFAGLDLAALEMRRHGGADGTGTPTQPPRSAGPPGMPAAGIPDTVAELFARTLPERPRAGRIVQLDGSVIAVELDRQLREQGVALCPLEHAVSAHPQVFDDWYARRLPVDRNKLEAAGAAFWSGGAFLHVPAGVRIEQPFEIVFAIGAAGSAQHSRVLIVGEPGSDFRVHEYGLAPDFDGQALHTEAFEMYLRDGARCRLAHFQDWGSGQVFDETTRFVGVGRDAFCHWLPALLGGHLVHQHLELAVSEPGGDMAFRGLFFTEADEQLDVFAVDLHETGPSGGDVHWRGAATGSSRASMEGLIEIDPGAQQSHTYLQIHSMMLSPKARIDAIPSVLVSADDVSASHGGTVGELDEELIFYMQSRGLDRPEAVRVIVEGFFEPLLGELGDEALQSLIRARVSAKLSAARADIEAYAASR